MRLRDQNGQPTDDDLVRCLFARMERDAYTQEEVSARTGIGQSTLSRWKVQLARGEPVRIGRASHRHIIRAFLAEPPKRDSGPAERRAKLLAAEYLEEVARRLRREAGE